MSECVFVRGGQERRQRRRSGAEVDAHVRSVHVQRLFQLRNNSSRERWEHSQRRVARQRQAAHALIVPEEILDHASHELPILLWSPDDIHHRLGKRRGSVLQNELDASLAVSTCCDIFHSSSKPRFHIIQLIHPRFICDVRKTGGDQLAQLLVRDAVVFARILDLGRGGERRVALEAGEQQDPG